MPPISLITSIPCRSWRRCRSMPRRSPPLVTKLPVDIAKFIIVLSDWVGIEEQEVLEFVVFDGPACISIELVEDWLEEAPLHWNFQLDEHQV